jgi:hypothetical protein
VLDAVHWISESWEETRIETVSKYFKLSRFPIWSEVKSTDNDSDDADDDISLIQLAKINSLKLELVSAICATMLVTSSLFLIITYEKHDGCLIRSRSYPSRGTWIHSCCSYFTFSVMCCVFVFVWLIPPVSCVSGVSSISGLYILGWPFGFLYL